MTAHERLTARRVAIHPSTTVVLAHATPACVLNSDHDPRERAFEAPNRTPFPSKPESALPELVTLPDLATPAQAIWRPLKSHR